MLVVNKAYDDNTAELIDLVSWSRSFYNEKALIELSKTHNVLGLSVSKNRINYISSYNIYTFPTEAEANEYIKENGLSYRNKIDLNSFCYVLEKTNEVIHVDYLVAYITEVERTYVGEHNSYTAYPNSAKRFDKKEAGRVAGVMTNKSKTGKIWRPVRMPCK